ncbi:hypothetical protein ACTVZO_11165 [Streptomyces sp. IBSNAI002]|uniref:hypothetical protein n=1 Tax=Streptomyces sp. IBSNAI002 TaxID=3457500 RepID=UPI003FD2BE17
MTATPHPASTAPAHANPVFRAVTRRDGRLCRTPECWELATVLVPADPAVRLVDAARLPADALTAVCAPHAADAARARPPYPRGGRRGRPRLRPTRPVHLTRGDPP